MGIVQKDHEGRQKEMNENEMTYEEFQQILKDAEVSTEFESILNKIVGYYYRISDECVADGHRSLAKDYMKKGNAIYNALDQRGYYDEYK